MTNIDKTTQARSRFFPGTTSNTKSNRLDRTEALSLRKNPSERTKQLEQIAQNDTKIQIPEAVKDFAKIKKAVDAAPPIDNSQKITDLKNRIQNGTYDIDYDGLANNILEQEF
jgi:negative regulator of flagellin synthesis FlgM